MKAITILAAVAAVGLTAPAVASDFSGPYIEARVGTDSISTGFDTKTLQYGVGIGYNVDITDRVTFGPYATLGNVFEQRDFAVGGRLGFGVSNTTQLFGKVGYVNSKPLDAIQNRKVEIDGVEVGGGVRLAVTKNLYVAPEYTFTSYGHGVNRHQTAVALGLQF